MTAVLAADPNNLPQSLISAAKRGHALFIDRLLSNYDVDINCKDLHGQTPLSLAASKGKTNVVKLLLSKDGIEINCKDRGGHTPLSLAASMGNTDVVELLLSKDDINTNCRDNYGRTPLLLAASKGKKDVVKLLLSKDGIDINCADIYVQTPLSWAVEKRSKEIVNLLLTKQCAICPGRTPLSWAAEHGLDKVVEFVLVNNIDDPNLEDAEGLTPLMRAAENEHKAVVDLLKPKDIGTTHLLVRQGNQQLINYLLSNDFEVNAINDRGETLLHLAAACGHRRIAEDLILRDAKIDLQDYDGITPLRRAILNKQPAVIEILLKEKAEFRDTKVDEWQEAFGMHARPIVQLCEGSDGSGSVQFHTTFPTAQESLQSIGTEKCLFLFNDLSAISDDLILPEVPIATSKPLKPNKLQALFSPGVTRREVDVSISLWLPLEEFRSHNLSRSHRSIKYCIAWKLVQSTNDKWIPQIYFSTLPCVQTPWDGIGLFQQLIAYLRKEWSDLCKIAESHLLDSIQRREQLDAKGKSPELLDRLADDARRWDDFRRSLRAQVKAASDFTTTYCKKYTSTDVPENVKRLIDEFDVDIGSRIGELDQTVRDLLQIVSVTLYSEERLFVDTHHLQEFAWTSITETRISTRLGQNVMLLTYISIFYLPLAFCAALWAIPDISNSSTRNPFIITSVIVGFTSLLVAFNLENIASSVGKAYQYWRKKVLRSMQGDSRWKERGKKLEDFDYTQTTPSEWWLVGYLVDKFVGLLAGRKQQIEV
ncbi:Ankyrin-1 [Penicillium rolfsii]|nr:Ankyrin-1 [Penicillium rolfsii]